MSLDIIKRIIKKIKIKNNLAYIYIGITFVIISIFIWFCTSPRVLMSVGSFTFGGSPPSFYSITIANLAYTLASHVTTEDNKPTPWAYYQRGRISFIKGDLHQALQFFDKELKHYPSHTKVYYMKGLTLGYAGREQEGIKAFKFYIQSTNDSWASFNDLAWLQFRVGDIDGALKTIEPVAIAQPHNPWIANTYAVLLMNKGRYNEAKQSLEKGLLTLEKMTEADWGYAYPGNDPKIYNEGLTAMKESFRDNLSLIEHKKQSN